MTLSIFTLTSLLASGLFNSSFEVTNDTSHQQSEHATLYIVRHAEKTSEQSHADLSKTGKSRAEALKEILRDVALDAIYTTDTTRTRNTVAPTAKAKKIALTVYTPEPGKLAKTIFMHHKNHTILICGHSNTIPELLRSLGVRFKDALLLEYDDLFIVTIDSNSDGSAPRVYLQRLHYPATY